MSNALNPTDSTTPKQVPPLPFGPLTGASPSTPTPTSFQHGGLLGGLPGEAVAAPNHGAGTFSTSASGAASVIAVPFTEDELQAACNQLEFVQKEDRTPKELLDLLLYCFRSKSSTNERKGYADALADLLKRSGLPLPKVVAALKSALLEAFGKRLPAYEAKLFSNALANNKRLADPATSYEAFRSRTVSLLNSVWDIAVKLSAPKDAAGATAHAAASGAAAPNVLASLQQLIANSALLQKDMKPGDVAALLRYTFNGDVEMDVTQDYEALLDDLLKKTGASRGVASTALKTELLKKLMTHPDIVDKSELLESTADLKKKFDLQNDYTSYRDGMQRQMHLQHAKQRIAESGANWQELSTAGSLSDAAELVTLLELQKNKSAPATRATIRSFFDRLLDRVMGQASQFDPSGASEEKAEATFRRLKAGITDALSRTLQLPPAAFD